MAKKSIEDVDLKGRRVLVRVDYNVPLEERDGKMVITDDTRIAETLPTLKYLSSKGAKTVLVAHLGRPKGKPDPKQSLAPVADRLAELLGRRVEFCGDSLIDDAGLAAVRRAADGLGGGDFILLENIRFYPGEEKNDPELGKRLASLCDVYVNDAFGSAHRAHSSTEAAAKAAPAAVSGYLMQKELRYLGDELESPDRPFVVILGGAKVSDKITVIDKLLDRADAMLIGGGMAYTFLSVMGQNIGNSLFEADKVEVARSAIDKAKAKGVKFLLPIDHMIVEKLDFPGKAVSAPKFTKVGEGIPDGWLGVDIGPETIKAYAEVARNARTVLWNGPMGVFEIKDCAKGTFAVAEAVASSGATSIIGGGDSVKAVKKSGQASKVTFMSTGGGASLEFLEGKELPGVAALNNK